MGQILLEIEDKVATLILDNPAKLNCLDRQMLGQLEQHLQHLEQTPEIRICLLEAKPSRAFCAGADITEWSALSARDFSQDWLKQGNRIFDRLAQLPMPTVAMIEGAVIGGGLELISCFDWRVMTSSSTCSLPETGIGVIPGWSGTQRLARLLPEPLLKSMVLLGRTVSAEELAQLGFAELVQDLANAHTEIIKQTIERSPEANRVAKMMLHAAVGENASAMIDSLAGGYTAASIDKEIGIQAFKSKRKPEF